MLRIAKYAITTRPKPWTRSRITPAPIPPAPPPPAGARSRPAPRPRARGGGGRLWGARARAAGRVDLGERLRGGVRRVIGVLGGLAGERVGRVAVADAAQRVRGRGA